MLFNSTPFLLLFLPITMAGYFWLGVGCKPAVTWWLACASLVFYDRPAFMVDGDEAGGSTVWHRNPSPSF
jgi:hypothetical protein